MLLNVTAGIRWTNMIAQKESPQREKRNIRTVMLLYSASRAIRRFAESGARKFVVGAVVWVASGGE